MYFIINIIKITSRFDHLSKEESMKDVQPFSKIELLNHLVSNPYYKNLCLFSYFYYIYFKVYLPIPIILL